MRAAAMGRLQPLLSPSHAPHDTFFVQWRIEQRERRGIASEVRQEERRQIALSRLDPLANRDVSKRFALSPA
jgi:hypothetical protein